MIVGYWVSVQIARGEVCAGHSVNRHPFSASKVFSPLEVGGNRCLRFQGVCGGLEWMIRLKLVVSAHLPRRPPSPTVLSTGIGA